jgi:hypothetical protein
MALSKMSRDLQVTTRDIWMAVADEACAVHRPEFWSSPGANDDLIERVRALRGARELVDWEVLLDGTFLVRCIVDADADFDAPSTADVCEVSRIRLPTGRLMLRTAGPRAVPQPIYELPPGDYEIRLEWFEPEESKVTLEGAAPVNPTGILTIRPAAG